MDTSAAVGHTPVEIHSAIRTKGYYRGLIAQLPITGHQEPEWLYVNTKVMQGFMQFRLDADCMARRLCSVDIFTALHGMQSRYSDGNSVCPSVRPSVRLSVCQTRGL